MILRLFLLDRCQNCRSGSGVEVCDHNVVGVSGSQIGESDFCSRCRIKRRGSINRHYFCGNIGIRVTSVKIHLNGFSGLVQTLEIDDNGCFGNSVSGGSPGRRRGNRANSDEITTCREINNGRSSSDRNICCLEKKVEIVFFTVLNVNFYDMRSRNSSTRLEDPPVSLVTTM